MNLLGCNRGTSVRPHHIRLTGNVRVEYGGRSGATSCIGYFGLILQVLHTNVVNERLIDSGIRTHVVSSSQTRTNEVQPFVHGILESNLTNTFRVQPGYELVDLKKMDMSQCRIW
jgi:hypothetical protein